MSRIAFAHFQPLNAAAHRATGVVAHAASVRKVDESKTMAGMLLAASLAALLVVADQLIDTWADGHLLAAWVALWTVTFAVLALLAPPLRLLTSSMASAMARRAQLAKERREEAQMWEFARQDYRLVAEIRQAMSRQQN